MKSIPSVGQYWPEQGGIRIGECPGQNGQPDYHLILPIHDDAMLPDLAWGSYGELVKGADCEWDGLANTQALVAAKTNHPAAEACAALTVEGFSDLYLPSIRETALCYAMTKEQFKKYWYWSSTQSSASYSFYQHFYNGCQCDDLKHYELHVRPVRRLLIINQFNN